jgi:hypothetical protein
VELRPADENLDEKRKLAKAFGLDQLSLVELPGIEPVVLPGVLPSELQFHYVPFRFSTSRYLRFRSRVLTASRVVAHRRELPDRLPDDLL